MSFIDQILFFAALVLIIASIFLSIRTRFIQIRMVPTMLRSLFQKERSHDGQYTVVPKKALFTAMSTTLGLGTMISPVIAIKLGGPGALVGYFLASVFGSAMTFTEVSLSVAHRKKLPDGKILGGPMQYLKDLISPFLAKWYAFCCFILLAAWSGAQSNQLAALLDSSLLHPFHVPKLATGMFLAIIVILLLIKGIHWIAVLSAKMVPIMFTLYVGACLWIIFDNLDMLPAIFSLLYRSCLSPCVFASGAIVGGITSSLRWGIFKGVHCTEAGLGTQTFPHSMAQTCSPTHQGVLAMISIYSAGLLAILGGLVALITDTWQDVTLSVGISMVVRSFEIYFSWGGVAIVGISAFLFAIGTVLGNAYNGSQCFLYLTQYKYLSLYFLICTIAIFFGAICDVTTVWGYSDIFVALAAIPHVCALMWISWKGHRILDDHAIPQIAV